MGVLAHLALLPPELDDKTPVAEESLVAGHRKIKLELNSCPLFSWKAFQVLKKVVQTTGVEGATV